MVENLYRYVGEAPCQQGDVLKVGTQFYKVHDLEPLYYEFTQVAPGFVDGTYQVLDMIPAKEYTYWVKAVGVNGAMTFMLNYPSGQPRQTPGARAVQRLDNVLAPYDHPWTFEFFVLAGDTLEANVDTGGIPLMASLWFYGWKIRFTLLPGAPADGKYKQLTDVRRFV